MAYQGSLPGLAGTSASSQLIVPEEKLFVPKKKPALSQQTRAAASVFTDWHIYSGNGIFNINYENVSMSVNSNVMVSISEMTTDDSPFIGLAPMSIANVAPYNHGTWVKVNIGWDKALRFQLMFVWAE